MNKPKDLESEIDDILSEFLENTAEALDETDFHRRIAASDEAIKEAKEAIKQLLQDAEREARINSLLDLEQWIKLHHPNHLAILECIEHMVISNLQFPEQPRLNHKDRINQLQASNEERGE